MSAIKIQFPFTINQTATNAVEVTLGSTGLRFPEVAVDHTDMLRFNQDVYITEDEHLAVLEKVQLEYVKMLMVATIKASFVPESGNAKSRM